MVAVHTREGSGTDTTSEESLNDKTAELLRRYGIGAEPEQRINDNTPSDRHSHKLDIAVEGEYECVVIEAEFDPAADVRVDAISRIPEVGVLLWREMPITRTFALIYPAHFKRQAASISSQELESTTDLRFWQLERDSDGQVVDGAEHTGGVADIAELLMSYWSQSRSTQSVDSIVDSASMAIDNAAVILSSDPYLQQEHEDADPAATCALIWLNALLFQELLAADLSPSALPDPHKGRTIPKPQADAPPQQTLDDWEFILSINWYPIFEIARASLSQIASPRDAQALGILRRQAADMAQSQAIRRHDIAGRIFHRLLGSRKFLATNYTTIPAAVLLARLAFGSPNSPLANKSALDEEALARDLRIVDPACGSGTLLMASLQEVMRACRGAKSAKGDTSSVNPRPFLEQSLYGFDVVPGAQHLTTTTLSMAETTQVLSGLPIYVMPHDCEPVSGQPRLGSLDFLKRAPNTGSTASMDLFPDRGHATRTDFAGEAHTDVHLPTSADLFICNPPYTRAGGPGDADHTEWNPLFGSVISEHDAKKMKAALRKTLDTTVGSLYAGLGSAFVALIDQQIGFGKMAALVLPLTSLTGSRWQSVREKLLSDYQIEWVIVSHDSRNRTKKKRLPGRRFVSFSESTRIAEVLIVATRQERIDTEHRVKFANLRHNPDDPSDAMALARSLLQNDGGTPITGQTELLRSKIRCPHPQFEYGEVVSVPQRTIPATAWPHVAFTDSSLTEHALIMWSGTLGTTDLPLAPLGELVDLGPYHMQIKGKAGGLFDCEEGTPAALDIPALWHHKSAALKTMTLGGNAILTRRRSLKQKQDEMLEEQGGHLHFAAELGHAPQRLAAAYTSQKMIGIRSWITLLPKTERTGMEQTLCLWLNSTPGLMLRIVHANRPYLGRSGVPHELAETMPVIDIAALTDEQLAAGQSIFDDLHEETLQGFAHISTDPVRQQINRRVVAEVLGGNDETAALVQALSDTLTKEPLLVTRH